MIHFTMAWSEAVAGLSDSAREHAQTALRLSPRETDIWLGWAYAALELSSFVDGDLDGTIKWGRLAIQMHAKMPARQLVMISGYAHLGDLESARSHLEALKNFAPGVLSAVLSGSRKIFKLSEHNRLLLEGLKRAGVE